MNKYEEITAARRLLELPERATMERIRANYRRLVRKWHPDTCKEPSVAGHACEEMTEKIVRAYRTILDYCSDYAYSFSKEEVKRHLSVEEWWLEQFGEDPVWGKGER